MTKKLNTIAMRKFCIAFILSGLLLLTSCATQAPSRFEGAQQESTSKGAAAVAKDSQSGGDFNRYFPDGGGGYERIYTQEKKGFAQAKLKKDGKDVATLSISDTLNSPSAVSKFKESSQKINGYPAVNQGSTATTVLVGDRYQVKIRSSSLSESERSQWLGKFDLRGLAKLN